MGSLSTWSSYPTQEKLKTHITGKQDLTWVEIGVNIASTATRILTMYSNNFKTMYLIDHYPDMPHIVAKVPVKNGAHPWTGDNRKSQKNLAHSNLQQWDKICVWIEEPSNKAQTKIAENSIDILNIDGDHTYNAVYGDLKNYYPKVKSGGLIILDDTDIPYVKMALLDFLELDLHTTNDIEVITDRGAPATSFFVKP